MGRLDDAAKHKVVELRKAGLSFRKIKAVLELDDIKVSAQAIYLYLKEFQGRAPGKVQPSQTGGSTGATRLPPGNGASREGWGNLNLQNHSTFPAASNLIKQTSSNSECGGNSLEAVQMSTTSRREQQHNGTKEENDIQIVSVTSLAQQQQKKVPQSSGAETVGASFPVVQSNALTRRRVALSPATSSILAARRRLLDRALSHKTKSFHQVASLLRKEQGSAGVHSSDPSSSLPQLPSSYDLTTEKTSVDGQPRVDASARRFPVQKLGLNVRPAQPPPRMGVRLPTRPLLPSSGPRAPVLHLQAPGSQRGAGREGNPSPQQLIQDAGGRSGLQEQVQTLSSEVRSLGFAVKMLVEQQCRLEREQSQQTHIQKQILSTLQSLVSKVGQCNHVQQPLNKTPSPPSVPAASASTSFSQDTFNFSQGPYSLCNQTQQNYNSLESLQSVETFKLSSPTSMNGFPSCGNAIGHSLPQSSPQNQTYATAYSESTSQTHASPYAESYTSAYKSNTLNFKMPEAKTPNFTSNCSAVGFRDCSLSTQQGMDCNISTGDPIINSIKVEGP